jgi:AbrB family looped-hinge helix DNA binding protein
MAVRAGALRLLGFGGSSACITRQISSALLGRLSSTIAETQSLAGAKRAAHLGTSHDCRSSMTSSKRKHSVVLSTNGRLTLPKAIRVRRRWTPGTRLILEETADGVQVKSASLFATASVNEVFGSLAYDGPARTLAEIDAAIAAHARRGPGARFEPWTSSASRRAPRNGRGHPRPMSGPLDWTVDVLVHVSAIFSRRLGLKRRFNHEPHEPHERASGNGYGT